MAIDLIRVINLCASSVVESLCFRSQGTSEMRILPIDQPPGLERRCGETAINCLIPVIVLVAGLAVVDHQALAADEKPEQVVRAARLRFVGGDKKVPLADVELLVTAGYGDEQKKFGPFRLDATGATTVKLPLAFYELHLSSKRELPFLHVEERWNNKSRGLGPRMCLYVTETGVEKWLMGERQPRGEEQATEPGQPPLITYTLLPACELVLRAVDADTGQGLPGVQFYTENAVGEDWGHAIDGENLGAAIERYTEPHDPKLYATDKDGKFRRLVGANAGYTYGVEVTPAGYELVAPQEEVAIDIKYGQLHAEQTFRFRRKPADGQGK